MIPLKIKFTNLEIDPSEFLYEHKNNPTNPTWIRRYFNWRDIPIYILKMWLTENTSGKWDVYNGRFSKNSPSFIIAFEDKNDAVFFNLTDNEKFWQDYMASNKQKSKI